jgi:hypothetical protein
MLEIGPGYLALGAVRAQRAAGMRDEVAFGGQPSKGRLHCAVRSKSRWLRLLDLNLSLGPLG